jgi:hypothetical protein
MGFPCPFCQLYEADETSELGRIAWRNPQTTMWLNEMTGCAGGSTFSFFPPQTNHRAGQ